MSQLFLPYAESWLVAALLLLLIGPVVIYLRGPWSYRREEILGGISADGARLYFEQFYPGLGPVASKDASARDAPYQEHLRAFYHKRFGRRRYIFPVGILLLVAFGPITWGITTALGWTGLRTLDAGALPAVAVAAVAGAYVWVVADLTSRWQFRDLLPVHLWHAALRFVIAVPVGYALGSMLATGLGLLVAFAGAAFPTGTLLTITRRVLRRQLNLGDLDEKAESELERLQGINTRTAERFADEGVTTILQLAYADPIELTMRCSSFSFSFVVDCVSQALAWIYFEDRLATVRLHSVRGAQEIATLVREIDAGGEPATAARHTMAVVSTRIELDIGVLERTLREIAGDPYTKFICDVWQPVAEEC